MSGERDGGDGGERRCRGPGSRPATDRRRVLLGIGAVALAGCLQLEEGDGTGETTSTPTADEGESGATSELDPIEVDDALDLTAIWDWRTDGSVHALDGRFVDGQNRLRTFDRGGEVTWTSEQTHPDWFYRFDGGDGIAADGDRFYVGAIAPGRSGDDDGEPAAVFAFDADGGDLDWEYRADHDATMIGYVATGDDHLYVAEIRAAGDVAPTVRALDADTGAVDWSHRLAEGFVSTLTRHDRRVYAATSTELVVLDAGDGEQRRSVDVRSGVDGTTRHGDRLYTVGDEFAVYDLSTDEVVRRAETVGPATYEPLVADDVVCAIAERDAAVGYDAATGDRRWAVQLPGPVARRPALGGGVLWISTSEDGLFAVDPATGRGLARLETERAGADVAAVDGVVFVGGLVQAAYAFERA